MTTTAPTITLCCGDCHAPLTLYRPSPFVQVLRCEQPACLARRCYGCRREGTLVIRSFSRTPVCCMCSRPQQRLAQAVEKEG